MIHMEFGGKLFPFQRILFAFSLTNKQNKGKGGPDKKLFEFCVILWTLPFFWSSTLQL